VDLLVRGVRQDDEWKFLRDFGQSGRDVRVWAPGGNGLVQLLGFRVVIGHAPALAAAAQCRLDHVGIGLPRPEHLVKAIGAEVGRERVQALRGEPIREHRSCHVAHLEVNQRAVAVKCYVGWPERRHGLLLLPVFPQNASKIRMGGGIGLPDRFERRRTIDSQASSP
jgi:hypothetical protein